MRRPDGVDLADHKWADLDDRDKMSLIQSYVQGKINDSLSARELEREAEELRADQGYYTVRLDEFKEKVWDQAEEIERLERQRDDWREEAYDLGWHLAYATKLLARYQTKPMRKAATND